MFSAISWAAIYFVVWWTTLFAVLPFGVRNQIDVGHVSPGTEPGAPAKAPIGRIVVITTLVSALIFGVIYILLTQDMFGLDDIPFLPKYDPPR